ncbi:MAG: MATE family efflux transporter [Planctomycetota bacterium]|jgi:putative MATE family efflux protein
MSPAAEPGAIRSGKLAGRSMWSAIWILALPVLLQQTMAAFIGLVDMIYAGRLPPDIVVSSLDAISIGAYVGWFVTIAMTGLGIGGQALIARAMGAGDPEQSHRALGNAVVLSVAWGVAVGIVLWFAAPPLAVICRLTGQTADLLVAYVQIIAYAMPFAGLMLVGSMCLHGAGETTLPSLIAVGANVVNVIVSWVLSGVDITFGDWTLMNPFSFDLYLHGIAAGTAISYFVGGVLTLWVVRRGVKDLRLETRDLAVDRSMAVRIFRVGVPGFFDSIMMWVANLLVLVVIGLVAAAEAVDGVPKQGLQGAHMIAVRWESFSFLPGFAIGTAAGALAGQYLGAGSPAMARRAILACIGMGCVVMGALGLVFIFGADLLTRVISGEAVHRAEAPPLLVIGGAVQVFFAISMVIRQGLRGVGDTRWTFVITTGASFGIRLPAAWVLGVWAGLGLQGVWLGLCGEIVLRAGFFAWRFLHGGWKRIEV